MGCPNFQPSTFAHHARVAGGSALASSVCVMSPGRTLGTAAFRDEPFARLGRRTVDRFFATFFGLFLTDFRFAIGSSLMDRRAPRSTLFPYTVLSRIAG